MNASEVSLVPPPVKVTCGTCPHLHPLPSGVVVMLGKKGGECRGHGKQILTEGNSFGQQQYRAFFPMLDADGDACRLHPQYREAKPA